MEGGRCPGTVAHRYSSCRYSMVGGWCSN